jgi:hypothetical protein
MVQFPFAAFGNIDLAFHIPFSWLLLAMLIFTPR